MMRATAKARCSSCTGWSQTRRSERCRSVNTRVSQAAAERRPSRRAASAGAAPARGFRPRGSRPRSGRPAPLAPGVALDTADHRAALVVEPVKAEREQLAHRRRPLRLGQPVAKAAHLGRRRLGRDLGIDQPARQLLQFDGGLRRRLDGRPGPHLAGFKPGHQALDARPILRLGQRRRRGRDRRKESAQGQHARVNSTCAHASTHLCPGSRTGLP